MDHQEFVKLIEDSPLAEHKEWFLESATPMIRMAPCDESQAGRSRIAGSPDVPSDFQWPQCEQGFRFMMQLDFSEMPVCVPNQPETGLLSFFLEHNEDNSNDWWSPECLRVFYFEETAALVTTPAPEGTPEFRPFPIKFDQGWDLPFILNFVKASYENTPLSSDDLDAFYDLRDSLHLSSCVGSRHDLFSNFCFGYPMDTCLLKNPLPGPDWMPLVNLFTFEELGLFFMDHARFMVFIESKRFAERDFSHLKTCAG